MSFDTKTRNRLASFVGKCRKLLCGDFKTPGGEMARLLAHYGIQDTGDCFDVAELTHLDEPGRETARTLRAILEHKQANAPKAKVWKKFDPAVYDIIQEQGFTVLNRLCALRMAEERKIIEHPCISKGLQSDGFQLYEYHSGKSNAKITPELRYQHFLFSLFDELSLDLGSLFDRFSPQGLLFPAPQALAEILEEINHPDIAHLWGEDETIGWIYQYWNSKEERAAMRDSKQGGSATPRNSRELAVRNQFFTPRYVVQFLTDNTLGRIWYEMTQGETDLANTCEYLVRRPNEIFLKPGESAPEVNSEKNERENLSQEALLKQPEYIEHRPLKDPREIRLLDPACGSMHFGLYAFDLFEQIYSEFWDLNIQNSRGSLIDLYTSKEAYLVDVPKLIIENNIHGVDIDPRAAQIAGLALWLRAQRSWKNAGLLAPQRPKVERSNIVCAESMPGDKQQLNAFTAKLHPAIAQMVETIFDKMQLAGEAGSLLKIEEEITTLVDDAKSKWKQIGKHEGEMFSNVELINADHRSGTQTQLDIGTWDLATLNSISTSNFFETAEQSIYTELARYSESAGQGSYKRKLFAHDAAQGFAFIDLCRKRYEAVVMNPPFGECGKGLASLLLSLGYFNKDLAADFVTSGLNRLSKEGKLGAITTRTIFFLKGCQAWRDILLNKHNGTASYLDLGYGVLDAAVEVGVFIINKPFINQPGQYIDARGEHDLIDRQGYGALNTLKSYAVYGQSFKSIPRSPFAYWCSPTLRNCFQNSPTIESQHKVLSGGNPREDFRFVRLWAECPTHVVANFVPYAKGGEFSIYTYDIHLKLKWENGGAELKQHCSDYRSGLGWSPDWRALMNNYERYFRPGISWPRRTSRLGFKLLPQGCVFGDKSPVIQSDTNEGKELLALTGYLNTTAFESAVKLMVGSSELAQSFEVGIIKSCPKPKINEELLSKTVQSLFDKSVNLLRLNELSLYFLWPVTSSIDSENIASFYTTQKEDHDLTVHSILEEQLVLEDHASERMGIEDSDPKINFEDFPFPSLVNTTENILSLLVGAIVGRWNINLSDLSHESVDPFSELPLCPPGMLQNESGLSLSNDELEALNTDGAYPLRVMVDGILADDADHSEDIVRRVQDSLKVIWNDSAEAIEQEACDILKVKQLRDYFAEGKAGGKFFKDHLKRYSKSRRKAPIYWPLSTESGTYTLWIYYHRITENTIYTAVTQFIEPKQEEVAETFARLNAKNDRTTAEDEELEAAQLLVAELATFRESLLEIAKFWKPNLNDGVQITAAPLWKHFRLKAWQKLLKDTWTKLEKGEYDWAHLAHSTWPDRVIPKCITDRSLAIAHSHDTALWESYTNDRGKEQWRSKQDAQETAEQLVQQLKK